MTEGDAAVHERWMQLALAEARAGMEAGEVPIGAVVVLDDTEIARAFNQPIRRHDPCAHAEIVAMRAAAEAVGNYRLTGATLYVTLEPCLMCAGALVHARIGRLVFGAREPKTGAVVSNLQALDLPHHNHRVEVVGGVLEPECRDLIQLFFAEKRGRD
ncbi:MAG: tRNA adenosine(34) deaminase TadA [Bacteroidales bacterium]